MAVRNRTFGELLASFSVLDAFLLIYHCVLLFAVLLGSGPLRSACLARLGVESALLVTGLVVVRGGALVKRPKLEALVYRATVFAAVTASYFQLRDVLAVATAHSLDAALFSLDLRVFGFEPSLAMDRWVTTWTTEYFAFFYFSYFVVLAAFALSFTFLVKDRSLVPELGLGISLVFCLAHVGYLVVPGYGPHRFLADQFEHALDGPLFWRWVLSTVQSGSAEKDIFPSLHTAAPAYFALFAWKHRAVKPFNWMWPVLAFFSSQIILSTMFLRWHYLADVLVGLSLSVVTFLLAGRVNAWERARRAVRGLPEAWPQSA